MSVTDKQHTILTNVSNPQPAIRERINVHLVKCTASLFDVFLVTNTYDYFDADHILDATSAA